MNIKEKEQIELLSKVIGRRINHENDSYIANEVRLIEVYLADKVWDLVELAYMDQR